MGAAAGEFSGFSPEDCSELDVGVVAGLTAGSGSAVGARVTLGSVVDVVARPTCGSSRVAIVGATAGPRMANAGPGLVDWAPSRSDWELELDTSWEVRLNGDQGGSRRMDATSAADSDRVRANQLFWLILIPLIWLTNFMRLRSQSSILPAEPILNREEAL